jgi:hypothetical protein
MRTSGWNLFILCMVVVAVLAFVVLLGNQPRVGLHILPPSPREVSTVGRRAPRVAERNCPEPSPGQWCPWVDEGQVQPQPVWP